MWQEQSGQNEKQKKLIVMNGMMTEPNSSKNYA